jgi:hypothetical protein
VEISEDKRKAADHALATHQQVRPVSRSIKVAIAVATAWAPPPE